MEVKAKAGINRIKTDPKYDNQLQEDGSSTGLAILEDFEEHSKVQKTMLEEIQNPRTRDAASKILEVNESAFRADMRAHVNDKSEAWNAMAQIDLFQIAIEGQDWAFANEQLDYMRDRMQERNEELREQTMRPQEEESYGVARVTTFHERNIDRVDDHERVDEREEQHRERRGEQE